MRRARRVIAFLLVLSPAVCLHAQQSTPPSEGSVDTDLTIMGRDDSIIPITAPEGSGPEGDSEEIVLPPIDAVELEALYVPPVLPPVTDSLMRPPAEAPENAAPARSAGK